MKINSTSVMNQDNPTDNAILVTLDGQQVHLSSRGYNLRGEGQPEVARREYGRLNNRASKRAAEKALGCKLQWVAK